MRLIMVRHGDPDYKKDSLTEKGWREAELLADRMAGLNVKEFYVSPLGRARDTASLTLEKMNRTATVCDWLQEFPVRIMRPDVKERRAIAWDWLPQDWTVYPEFFDREGWMSQAAFAEAGVGDEYRMVTESFDKILAEHGYCRDGLIYRAERPNRDTLVFFCHFGLICVLLSHLINVSPMVLWHGTCAPPTSVTTAITEERRQGKAVFRVNGFGDISHLYAAGEEPAFSARFCETYDDTWERHD